VLYGEGSFDKGGQFVAGSDDATVDRRMAIVIEIHHHRLVRHILYHLSLSYDLVGEFILQEIDHLFAHRGRQERQDGGLKMHLLVAFDGLLKSLDGALYR